MKKLYPFLLVFVLLLTCLQAAAMNTEKTVGEVLYHQSFDDISDFSVSGIRIGTGSTTQALVSCPENVLEISTYDSGRVYILLPEADKGDSGSYTIEFSFAFTDIRSDNGYIAPILTCRGVEPTNITSLKIRADGTVDQFSDPDPLLREAISGGKKIVVRIPVENGVLHKIYMTAGCTEYVLERNNVMLISDGTIGFGIRNANAEIDEIYVVCGTDYTEKCGYYADQSYASDCTPVTIPTESSNTECVQTAPPTGDNSGKMEIVAIVGLVGALVCALLLGRKRK